MSLDKGIEHGREHRKPYTGAKKVDSTCRNNGGDFYFRNNRKHKFNVDELAADSQIEEEFAPRNRTSMGRHPKGETWEEYFDRIHRQDEFTYKFKIIHWWENKKDGKPKKK